AWSSRRRSPRRCAAPCVRSVASSPSTSNSSRWSRSYRNGRNTMQVHISIGENHHFELREALLVYGDRQRSFVTRHQVTLHKDAPPTLEPAQPLTLGFVESLVRSLS